MQKIHLKFYKKKILDDLLKISIYFSLGGKMNEILVNLLDKQIINELILAIIIFIGSIIFAINEDEMDKNYEKTYIIIIYSLFFLSFVFLGTDKEGINSALSIFYWVPITFNIIFGINYGYISDPISKFLGKIKLTGYKTIEWFYITKTYIIYLFILAIKLTSLIKINNMILRTSVYYILLAGFFIYHLLSNMVDTFGVYNFSYMRDIFFANRKLNFESDEVDPETVTDLLSFLIYVEDKDFFVRRSSVYNPLLIIRRKLADRKDLYTPDPEKHLPKISRKIIYYFDSLKYLLNLSLIVLKNWRTYIRGFSTIEQQLIRVQIMLPDTYELYTFRRKLFVELVVNPMFFASFKNRRAIFRNISRSDIHFEEYKLEILMVYYNTILNKLNSIEDLIDKLAKESRLDEEMLWNMYYDDYCYSDFKKTTNEIILTGIKKKSMT